MDCGILSDRAIFSCANSSTQEIITSQNPQYMYSNYALFFFTQNYHSINHTRISLLDYFFFLLHIASNISGFLKFLHTRQTKTSPFHLYLIVYKESGSKAQCCHVQLHQQVYTSTQKRKLHCFEVIMTSVRMLVKLQSDYIHAFSCKSYQNQ